MGKKGDFSRMKDHVNFFAPLNLLDAIDIYVLSDKSAPVRERHHYLASFLVSPELVADRPNKSLLTRAKEILKPAEFEEFSSFINSSEVREILKDPQGYMRENSRKLTGI